MLRSLPRVVLLPLILAACGDSQGNPPNDAGARTDTISRPDVPQALDAGLDAPALPDVVALPDAPDARATPDASPTDLPTLDTPPAPEDRPAPPDTATPPDALLEDRPIDAPSPPDVALAPDAPRCPGAQLLCGGACTDTATSAQHCGRCDNACPSSMPNTRPVCRAGACDLECATTHTNCDGDWSNGCETPSGDARTCNGTCTNITTDVANCGDCGRRCTFTTGTPNAVALCRSRACALTCAPGFADCDGNFANGCEADLAGISHCGRCNNGCTGPSGADPVCRAGVCGITCQANRGDCDLNAANGCEVNLATSATNCGRCGSACPPVPNGVPTCSAGVCVREICSAGYSNCNGNPADGCEANLNTDRLNCGTCGSLCPTPLGFLNGTATCRAGACDAECSTGFGNCDGNLANGCETDLQNTRTHCGACGRVCAAGLDCVRGFCLP